MSFLSKIALVIDQIYLIFRYKPQISELCPEPKSVGDSNQNHNLFEQIQRNRTGSFDEIMDFVDFQGISIYFAMVFNENL